MLGGCQPAPTNKPAKGPDEQVANGNVATNEASPAGRRDASADELLARMVAAYRKADRYGDTGTLTFSSKEKDAPEPKTEKGIPLSVTLARPNKLRLHAFGAIVVSNGEYLHATVPDASEQVLTRPAPAKLSMSDLTSDPILAGSVTGGIEHFEIPQLRLLVSDNPFGGLAAGEATRLKDDMLDGITCHRVQVDTPDGKAVYWIDHRNDTLVRYEFPTNAIRKQVDPDGHLAEISVVAEFVGAKLNLELPVEAFAFEVPKGAQQVKFFLPPAPQPPSPLLGRDVEDFTFTTLDGKKVDRQSLAGKVVVMDAWATWCGWCFRGFPNLEKVYQKFKGNDKVAIMAVNTDTPDVSDETVRESFAKNKLTIPIVRDTESAMEKVFRVEGLPTMFVLGTDGRLQVFEVGYKEDLAEVLPGQIERLLKGEDFAENALKKYDAEREEYNKKASEAIIGTTTEVAIPPTKLAEKSQPMSLELTPLWTAEGVSKPGNLLVIEEAAGPAQVYVVDGWRNVVLLDPSGKAVTNFELEIPENAAVSFLRTAVDRDGKRYFAAFANGQQQFHLFDENWKRLLSYPDPADSGAHPGISDVQIADLDGDGHPELLVGYWGPVGVQCVGIDGKKQWSNRTVENVLRLAITDQDDKGKRRILCANGRDTIVPIDHLGEAQEPVRLLNRAPHTLVTADLDGQAPLELCGLVATEIGVSVALGIGLDGSEQWNYPLPNGVQNVPVETIVAGRVLADGPGNWLFPGVDGSVHILSADGKLVDQFNYGSIITGLAATKLEGSPVLLISTGGGLTALKVTPRQP